MPDVIAIDGPAGSGKSTTARAVSARLNFAYLDSGAVYRGLALGVERACADPSDEAALLACAAAVDLRVRPRRGACRIFLGTEDVTAQLRSQSLGQLASRLAGLMAVRELVRHHLQDAALGRPCVVEGRDMGTTVFPNAALKIYFDAPLDVRARRRHAELASRGVAADADGIRAEIAARDARDTRRAASPLRIAPDAIVIDNRDLDIRGQVEVVADLYRGRGRRRGNRLYRAARAIVRFVGAVFLRIRVAGSENVPYGGCLIACNHRSYIDPPLIGGYAPGAIGFLAKAELFGIPLLGPLIRHLNAIPVNRGSYDRTALRAVSARLREALPVLVFPEGTRRREDQPIAIRAGIGLLARMSGAAVVPARITSSAELRDVLLRRRRITLAFGSSLRHGAPSESDAQFAERVMAAIRALGPPGGR